jgi:hypothetical protein
MIIINTFPFSEAYELDVLLIKLHTENNGVTEWVICENDYTFQGQFKGHSLRELIDEDSRFNLFKDKITIIEKSFTCRLSGLDGDHSIGDAQRNFSTEYIISNYPDSNTWVVTSDVDQAYDFSGNNRTDFIYESLKKHPNTALTFAIRKSWYDYNNYGNCQPQHAFIPVEWVRKANRIVYIENNGPHIIMQKTGTDVPQEFSAFEYTFCYTKEHINRKLNTYGHHPFCEADVDIALKCNHWIRRSMVGDICPPPNSTRKETHWFEFEELSENNAPGYVLDNFDKLKTNNVDANYKENRNIHYPNYFGGRQ